MTNSEWIFNKVKSPLCFWEYSQICSGKWLVIDHTYISDMRDWSCIICKCIRQIDTWLAIKSELWIPASEKKVPGSCWHTPWNTAADGSSSGMPETWIAFLSASTWRSPECCGLSEWATIWELLSMHLPGLFSASFSLSLCHSLSLSFFLSAYKR